MKKKWNTEKIKWKFFDKGIISCEARLPGCVNFMLSFHHRRKRRHYLNKGDLINEFNEVILVCCECHEKLEQDSQLTKEVFNRLRGKE
jgi:hypothetical protein